MKYKKILIIALIVTFVLGSSAFTYAYMSETEGLDKSVTLNVNGQELNPQNVNWNVFMFEGLPFLKYNQDGEHEPYDLGKMTATPTLKAPQGCTLTITIKNADGSIVFDGDQEAFKSYTTKQNGKYEYIVSVNSPTKEGSSYGNFHYCFVTDIVLKTKITVEANQVKQGDVISVKVTDLPQGIVPTIKTTLGMAIFTENNGVHQAFIPIGYLKPVGGYTISVTAGDVSKDVVVNVASGNFQKQYMNINTENTAITEASSPKAYQQFRDAIYPLYETADSTRYWSDKFIQPVNGRITTQFGLTRYTNGSSTPSGHGALDIAVAAGTPVLAPAAGRVVFSDYLYNTGNTIAIEHGGGLKSYYYHMNARFVKVGDVVSQGQKIGEVGNTGYSTGAHLHFEVKIGKESINPWNLINGTGEFF